MNTSRFLLHEADLPNRLWGEVAGTAVFLHNHLPHEAIGGDTPYHGMFGKQVNLAFSGPLVLGLSHVRRAIVQSCRKWLGKASSWVTTTRVRRTAFMIATLQYHRRITSARNVVFVEPACTTVPSTGGDREVKDYDNNDKDLMDHYT